MVCVRVGSIAKPCQASLEVTYQLERLCVTRYCDGHRIHTIQPCESFIVELMKVIGIPRGKKILGLEH